MKQAETEDAAAYKGITEEKSKGEDRKSKANREETETSMDYAGRKGKQIELCREARSIDQLS
jgi:hypothetical protein